MKQGEIYLARVTYTSFFDDKIRPVVLVGKTEVADIDYLIGPITSHSPRNQYDVVIQFWKEAGLEKPSVVRTAKLRTIESQFLLRKIGILQEEDLQRVLSTCRSLF